MPVHTHMNIHIQNILNAIEFEYNLKSIGEGYCLKVCQPHHQNLKFNV